MYLLDTNTIIYSIRHPSSQCALRLSEHIGKDLFISVITYSELMFGVYNSSCPTQNEEALNLFLSGIRILDLEVRDGKVFGFLLAERKKRGQLHSNKDRDLIIGAQALSRGLTLITHNEKDFSFIKGLTIEDWIS